MTKPKICIVGPGVVGQATGKAFLAKGFEVGFLGRTEEKVKKLRKEGYDAFTADEMVNGNYDYDITMLTVPTPTIDGKTDLSAMEKAATDLGKRMKHIKKYHLVVVKSTVVPGTTEDLVIKTVEKYSGKRVGKDFGACMNPEYLREETSFEDTIKAWIVVIGEYDRKSGDFLETVYKGFDCPLYRCTIKEAEMQKYVHNLFNATKIAFFNEMREVAKAVDLDAQKIFNLTAISCEGVWNPQYGMRDKGPFDGSCLPKDTKAFRHWATSRGLDVDLLDRVIEANETFAKKLGVRTQKTEYTL